MTVGPVPLVVGVTGHRDLVAAQEPALEAAVEAFFSDLRHRFADLPLLVMTPLAEGADRLVARVAYRLGVAISIVLPMPRVLYEQDFGESSGEVFQEMLGYGDVVEIPLLRDLGGEAIGADQARDAQYEFLGIYMAAHCHILLALWDGKPSNAPGGTAHVIRFHHENELILISGDEPRSAIDFSEDESDLAYHIACSRREGGAPAQGLAPGQGRWLTRDDVEPHSVDMPPRYRAVFLRQMLLNRDLSRLPEAAGSERLPPAQSAAANDIAGLFVRVDALAVRFQRRALRALRSIYLLVALTGLSFILYADFPGHDQMIWLYLGVLAAGFVLYLLERRGAWYRRYLDYRALGEGLRVQFYWALAGVRCKGVAEFPHDKFMKRQDLELGWIRNVMRYAARRTDAEVPPVDESGLAAAIEHWVGDGSDGQGHYYRDRALRGRRRSRFTSVLGVVGFSAGLAAALVLAFLQARLGTLAVNALIAAMAGLPFLAAVRSSYAQRVSEHELIAQYAYMQRIFSNAERLVAATASGRRRRAILLALGAEALDEVGRWLVRQREQPVSGGQLFTPG